MERLKKGLNRPVVSVDIITIVVNYLILVTYGLAIGLPAALGICLLVELFLKD